MRECQQAGPSLCRPLPPAPPPTPPTHATPGTRPLLQGQGVSLAVVPTRFFYSWSVSIQPPEWRAPKQPPSMWQVEPTTLGAAGGLPFPWAGESRKQEV